ncbi:MAG: segregation/condensation protein A [Caldilinea sp.]|nr:segregation/condensation protein A [Caldilinea sp.]
MTTPISNRDQTLGAGYAVTLPVYEGPLDLLLRMIETQEMDISVVSLMSVTDQYLRTLNQLEEIEAGALAEFLVIASRLLYIKSYHLLPKPRPPVDDEEEASGDALVRQLLEYRRFKEAASALRLREEAGMRVYLRTAPRPDVEKRLDLSNVDLEKLQRALRKVLQRMPVDPPMPRVKTYTITVSEQIENVRSYLYAAMNAGARTRRGVSFEALLSRSATRIEVIVTFLAVLELVKLREIEVVQDDTFGEIELVPVGAGEAGAAQDGAQESTQESAQDGAEG